MWRYSLEYILTIDAGTSAFKTMLWDETGTETGMYSEELALITTQTEFVEFPAEEYWKTARRGIKHILRASRVDPKNIRVVAISSQGETLINLDKDGRPLRKAIVWMDNRSTKEAILLENEFGKEEIFRVTGQPEVVPTWPATKILWQKKNEPEVFRNTAKFLMVEDYLLYRLAGRYAGEYSTHSSALWLDINRKCLWKEMLEFLEVRSSRFPELTDSGETIGNVSAEAGLQTGLTEGTTVVTGALDQAAGAIGAGNIEAGICSETTGSALAACVLISRPPVNPRYRIPCHCHAIKNSYYLMAWGQTAGIALKWFKDNFCEQEIAEAHAQKRSVYEILEEKLRDIPPGSEGLVFLPHLNGAACPEFNPYARGVFFGISLNHRKAHFVRAIMESVAFMLRINIKLLEKTGGTILEIRSAGGGSKSMIWNQIKADVLQKTIKPVLVNEAASVGAAIIAGTAVGIFKDVKEGCRRMVRIGESIAPDSINQQAYKSGYDMYGQLYQNLRPLFVPVKHH